MSSGTVSSRLHSRTRHSSVSGAGAASSSTARRRLGGRSACDAQSPGRRGGCEEGYWLLVLGYWGARFPADLRNHAFLNFVIHLAAPSSAGFTKPSAAAASVKPGPLRPPETKLTLTPDP